MKTAAFVTCVASAAAAENTKGQVQMLARQLIMSQVTMEQRVRAEGGSGLTLTRSYSSGSRAFHTSSDSEYKLPSFQLPNSTPELISACIPLPTHFQSVTWARPHFTVTTTCRKPWAWPSLAPSSTVLSSGPDTTTIHCEHQAKRQVHTAQHSRSNSLLSPLLYWPSPLLQADC